MFNPLVGYIKTVRTRRTVITIESRSYTGTISLIRREVTMLDDLEQYDCAMCAAVRISAVTPSGKTITYERGRWQ